MSVVVVGLNHRQVPLPLLEAVAVTDEALPKALHDLVQRDHIDEVAVVSTCMRTEVYASVTRFHGAVADIRTFLADWSGLPPEVLTDHLYDFHDETAVRHLFDVASGLDSALLGEGEILRQVRTAGEVARSERAAGPVIDRVFRHAVETGKRVRSETAIAQGTTSLSHTAVSLAGAVGAPLSSVPPEAAGCPVIGHRQPAGAPTPVVPASAAGPLDAGSPTPGSPDPVASGGHPGDAAGHAAVTSAAFDAGEVPTEAGEASGPPCTWADLLAGRSVLVVGAGEMGEALATLVAGASGTRVLVANRTDERAAWLADRVGAAAVAWADLPAAVGEADIVLTSTSAPSPILDAGAVGDRSERPLVVVDLAVPRDVAPAVADLPGVTLFDITHLKRHAEQAMEGRRREVPAARRIIDEELTRYSRLSAERGVAPTLAALHARGEAIRLAELGRLQGRLGPLDERQRKAVDALTHGIVAKLLHEPTVRLKSAAGDGRGDRLAGTVEELFDL